ncbi:hypothetical protein RJ035_007360 [Blastomyces gilchristii]
MTMSNNSSLPWADCDTGFLDSDGIAIRKCSTEFLSTLCTAYMDCIADDKIHVQDSSANQLFERVMDELRRLSSSPTLFPSTETQTRFWSLLTHAIDTQVTAAQSKIDEEMRADFLMRANLLAREEDRLLQSLNRPTFAAPLSLPLDMISKISPISVPNSLPLDSSMNIHGIRPSYLHSRPALSVFTHTYGEGKFSRSKNKTKKKYSALSREANVTDRLENLSSWTVAGRVLGLKRRIIILGIKLLASKLSYTCELSKRMHIPWNNGNGTRFKYICLPSRHK